MYIGIVLYVLIVFSVRRESLKRILVDETLPNGVPSHSSPGPANRSSTELGGHARPIMSRTRTWSHPAWLIPKRTLAGHSRLARADPAPCGPSRVPIEPMRPNRANRPCTTMTSRDSIIFHGLLSHFDKVSTISEFPVDHFATLLLQCSAVFVSVLSNFR
jgi:hypothetical protein